MEKRQVLIAVLVIAIIVATWMLWPKGKACINPIPLRGSAGGLRKIFARNSRSMGVMSAAEPCPPPSCAEFASCSTGNLRKRLISSAARFPDIDSSKISDALAMKVLQGCDGTDAGACADFLPYVCSCNGIADMCRNAPDPKPEVCKQNPRTPTAAYGINCSEIRLTQGPCPCDCDGGGGGGGIGCPPITGAWHNGTQAAQFATRPSTSGQLCEVVLTTASGDVIPGYIPRDKPLTIFWSVEGPAETASIDPSFKKIVWRDSIYTKD